jgi:hypothetical protein
MAVTPNMGTIDRTFRIVAGALLIYIGFVNEGLISSETLKYILGTIGALNVASSVAGVCPLYIFANINTRRRV